MKITKFGWVFLCCLSTLPQAWAQANFDNSIRKGIIYDKELAFDFRIHTHGFFSFGVDVGTIKTYYKTQFYHFEVGGIKHPREYRQDRLQASLSSSYIYGKQNNLYALRGGWGEKRYFSEKGENRGVAVGISYELGPSLGLLRPYYLDLELDGDIKPMPYTPETASAFLDINRIQGASGIAYGWDDLKFRPGGHAFAGIHLDWGAFDKTVRALEVGVMADFYFGKVPIMVSEDNRAYFINLFVNFQFGRRR